MATIKLYDVREPMAVGQEVFDALMADGEGEIVTDRDALAYAFHCACENIGLKWEGLADAASAALSDDDVVTGRYAIEARESMAHAVDVAYTLMGLIWDTTPGIREAEERYDPATGVGEAPSDDDEPEGGE